MSVIIINNSPEVVAVRAITEKNERQHWFLHEWPKLRKTLPFSEMSNEELKENGLPYALIPHGKIARRMSSKKVLAK